MYTTSTPPGHCANNQCLYMPAKRLLILIVNFFKLHIFDSTESLTKISDNLDKILEILLKWSLKDPYRNPQRSVKDFASYLFK